MTSLCLPVQQLKTMLMLVLEFKELWLGLGLRFVAVGVDVWGWLRSWDLEWTRNGYRLKVSSVLKRI
jgi:hypothetical protein